MAMKSKEDKEGVLNTTVSFSPHRHVKKLSSLFFLIPSLIQQQTTRIHITTARRRDKTRPRNKQVHQVGVI